MMKIIDYIKNEKDQLEKLEKAFSGLKFQPESGECTLVQNIETSLRMVDEDQKVVEAVAEEQTSTKIAQALIRRTEQLHRTRAFLVQALDSAANVEIMI
jgi:hypothetical protein